MVDETSQGRAVAVPAGRLARLSRLGSMTAGVAGSMALNGVAQLGQGKRPAMRDLLLTPRNITRITDQLAQMRGAAMKIGQLISMDTGDVLPPELSEIMGRLRSDAHFMPPPQLKKVLNANWGEGWIRHFKRFDVRPLAAASIGQVHRAELRDGRDLAIKVQYPGIAQSIDSDVANVGALIRMSGLLPAGLEIEPYLDEACKQLHEETDYVLEGAHLSRFGALLADDPHFDLPVLHEDWTTRDVLAMSFVEGRAIESAASASQQDRDEIGARLIELMLNELFRFGWMQTDPNFANYRHNPETGRIVLLDFGATREISPEIAGQYRRLMRAGFAEDRAAMDEIAREIGFYGDGTLEAHRTQILRMMAMVFEAIKKAPVFDFASTDLPNRMQDEGTKLAEAGFVPEPLPMDILYLQRKFGGMFLLCAKLGARVPLMAMLEGYLGE